MEYKICPIHEECGGCSYQGVAYEDQLKNKEGEVRGAIRAAGLDPNIFLGIKACPEVFSYRDKMEYTFGNAQKEGPIELGLHKKKSFISILTADQCQLVPDDFNKILSATLEFVKEKGYTFFHKKFHYGLMRSLVIRKGFRTNELLINIVTTTESEFDEDAFLKMILGLELDAKIAGVLHTINNNISDVIQCEELRILYGRNYYEEEIMGLRFKVGAFSFFQTNVAAAERLYKDAISLIDDLNGKVVYDLYCGTGTITQAMALKAKKAIGVEIVEEAIETARESARINGLSNCEFIADDVQNALAGIEEKPDVIVVDPPRSGIFPKALMQILGYGVKQIIYISCNPKTFVETLRAAKMARYETKQITAYDNFPYTKHTEAIALLERK
ncbi:MAG: 23S rRNA (uracil(1939)-C(5))-methyltransferase RlmD [Clostridia bacterium]|nr:23S rRNA (uracil(1939)-C(5))-methyltransferase RlmD [Clostridia bacterium]